MKAFQSLSGEVRDTMFLLPITQPGSHDKNVFDVKFYPDKKSFNCLFLF